MSGRKTSTPMLNDKQSILIGNGMNINFGGRAYTNEFIIKRIIYNARANKYDVLFGGTISGKEIALLFFEFAKWANEISAGKHDSAVLKEDVQALESFKKRYDWHIQKYYEVGLEDWLFIAKVFMCENKDLEIPWETVKQGFERLILDSIYNDGDVNEIYLKMGKPVRKFLMKFDEIFTVNYDVNIEKLTGREVYHLHGSYEIPSNSENPRTVQGFIRTQKGESVTIPEFRHCYCNALLDYDGENKYKIADALERIDSKMLPQIETKNLGRYEAMAREWLQIKKEHPELSYGTKYHFEQLENLSGDLHIVGLSPNNDSHIFRLIEKSNVQKIIFYYHSESDKNVRTEKEIEYVDVRKLWTNLGVSKPVYCFNYDLSPLKDDSMYKVICTLSGDEIDRETLIKEANKLPQYRIDQLGGKTYQLIKDRINQKLENEDELERAFCEISRIALREGVLPSVLFVFFLKNFENLRKMDN